MTVYLKDHIAVALQQAYMHSDKVDLITAYLNSGIFRILDLSVLVNKDISLYVRGNKRDFLSGSVDIKTLSKLYQVGVKCYLVRDLHGKAYIFNQMKLFIGSANLTHNGLGTNTNSNLECLVELPLQEAEFNYLISMTSTRVLLTPKILKDIEYSVDCAVSNENNLLGSEEWPFLVSHEKYETIRIYDLPWCHPLEDSHEECDFLHDYHVLGLISKSSVNLFDFKTSYLYQFILFNLNQSNNGQLYFGEIKSLVLKSLEEHGNIIIKPYIFNIFGYFSMLNDPVIGYDRPNYSERLFLRK